MLKTCTDCGGAITRRSDTFEAHVGRRTVAVPGEYDRCAECGEFYFAPGEMDAMMKRASAVVRSEEGLLLPEQIRSFRKGNGLTQPRLEDLLGAGPKPWADGKRVRSSRMARQIRCCDCSWTCRMPFSICSTSGELSRTSYRWYQCGGASPIATR